MHLKTIKMRLTVSPIRILVGAMFILASGSEVRAQSGVKFSDNVDHVQCENTFQADELGNITITMKSTFNRAGFQRWQDMYGSDIALLKRDMAKNLSQMDAYDWKIDHDDLNRTVTTSLKAHGAVNYKGNGVFQYDIPKQFGVGTRSDNTYTFHYTVEDSPQQVEDVTLKCIMPVAASEFHEDFSGDPGSISYSMPVASNSHMGLLSSGIVFVVLGMGALIAGFVLPKRAVPTRVAISAIQSRVLPSQTRSSLPPMSPPAQPGQYNPAQHNPASAAPAQANVQQAPPPGTRDFRPPVD